LAHQQCGGRHGAFLTRLPSIGIGTMPGDAENFLSGYINAMRHPVEFGGISIASHWGAI
jgi:hypothetical protein